ncbi:MAG: hypothetical protein HYR76_12820 [Ignavibacteria bacterium]|nr:hypothetical protein [Ignavibacteria bacterium]
MNKHVFIARVLLIDGVLMIVLAFIHLFSTPLISKWLAHELTKETMTTVSPPFLLNHIVVGILLIPFGVSTLYSAAGVRTGQPWARGIAITNSVAVLFLPLLVGILMGPEYYRSTPFLVAAILITVIGVSMLIPLIWLSGRPRAHGSVKSGT